MTMSPRLRVCHRYTSDSQLRVDRALAPTIFPWHHAPHISLHSLLARTVVVVVVVVVSRFRASRMLCAFSRRRNAGANARSRRRRRRRRRRRSGARRDARRDTPRIRTNMTRIASANDVDPLLLYRRRTRKILQRVIVIVVKGTPLLLIHSSLGFLLNENAFQGGRPNSTTSLQPTRETLEAEVGCDFVHADFWRTVKKSGFSTNLMRTGRHCSDVWRSDDWSAPHCDVRRSRDRACHAPTRGAMEGRVISHHRHHHCCEQRERYRDDVLPPDPRAKGSRSGAFPRFRVASTGRWARRQTRAELLRQLRSLWPRCENGGSAVRSVPIRSSGRSA
mmetsp:Transcript_10323/g.25962  ORF Transcript_10323/g.25962 Transcript_10323/m.25962 type:complete len:334 (-) Transcript_10323:1471-2472(-)